MAGGQQGSIPHTLLIKPEAHTHTHTHTHTYTHTHTHTHTQREGEQERDHDPRPDGGPDNHLVTEVRNQSFSRDHDKFVNVSYYLLPG